MGTGQPAWLHSVGGITVRCVSLSPSSGLIVGRLEAHFCFQQLSGNRAAQGANPDASLPRCFERAPYMEASEDTVRGCACPPRSWHACHGDDAWRKHTLTFILDILVCRNLKLNILSTYTMRNPFIETKSNWRPKDCWPEMKYLKNKI